MNAAAKEQSAAAAATQEWFTVTEAADYLRMSVNAIHQQISRGHLAPDARARPGLRVHRFRRATLDKFLTGE